jgi:hypothetical protein
MDVDAPKPEIRATATEQDHMTPVFTPAETMDE